MKTLPLILAACVMGTAGPACAGDPAPSILQLFSYTVGDLPGFRKGYRAHLSWHARHRDPLAWYGWTVQAGPRRGMFIDGTAGATLAGLDARPDLAGDGADFAATVGKRARAADIETWALWPMPSTAVPLEERRPSKVVDVNLLTVAPGDATVFERGVEQLARQHRANGARLTWYRRLRGGGAAGYMLLVSRERWADLAGAGSLSELLKGAYVSTVAAVDDALRPVRTLGTETWTYEPSLSLLSGTTAPH